MLKRSLMVTVVVLALWAPLGTAGAEPAKIGWIDAQKVLDESKAGSGIKKRLEEYRDSRQKVIDLEEKDLSTMEDKLKQQMSVLSPDAQRDKQQEFQSKLADYRKKVMELSQELQDKKQALLQEFSDLLSRSVAAVAKANGYDYVLDKGAETGVLYGNPAYDMTQKVKAELDAQHP